MDGSSACQGVLVRASVLPDAVLPLGLPVQAHSIAGAPVSLEELAQLLLRSGWPWLGVGGPLAEYQAHPRGAAEVIFGPVGGACQDVGGREMLLSRLTGQGPPCSPRTRPWPQKPLRRASQHITRGTLHSLAWNRRPDSAFPGFSASDFLCAPWSQVTAGCRPSLRTPPETLTPLSHT